MSHELRQVTISMIVFDSDRTRKVVPEGVEAVYPDETMEAFRAWLQAKLVEWETGSHGPEGLRGDQVAQIIDVN